MPVAPNIARLLPGSAPASLLAARLSGGSLTFYTINPETDAQVSVLGSVAAPSGLDAQALRRSVLVDSGGSPLIHGQNDGTSPSQLFSITPSAVGQEDWVTSSMNAVSDPSGLATGSVFVAGGVAYQYLFGIDVWPSDPFSQLRIELHPLSSSGRGTPGPSQLYEDADNFNDASYYGIAGPSLYVQLGVVSPSRFDNIEGGVPSTAFVRTEGVTEESIATGTNNLYQAGYDSGRTMGVQLGGTLYEFRESPGGFLDSDDIISPADDGGSMSTDQSIYTTWDSATSRLYWYDVASAFPASEEGYSEPTTDDGTPDMVWAWLVDAIPSGLTSVGGGGG